MPVSPTFIYTMALESLSPPVLAAPTSGLSETEHFRPNHPLPARCHDLSQSASPRRLADRHSCDSRLLPRGKSLAQARPGPVPRSAVLPPLCDAPSSPSACLRLCCAQINLLTMILVSPQLGLGISVISRLASHPFIAPKTHRLSPLG